MEFFIPKSNYQHHHRQITCLKFSPDGKKVLTASLDGNSFEIDSETNQIISKISHGAAVFDTSYSTDGTYIAFLVNRRGIEIYATGVTDRPSFYIPAATGMQGFVQFISPQDAIIAEYSRFGSGVLYDIERYQLYPEQKVTQSYTFSKIERPCAFSVSPDSSRILVACQKGTVQLWNVEGNDLPVETTIAYEDLNGVMVAWEDKVFFSRTATGIRKCDLETLKPLDELKEVSHARIIASEILPKEKKLLIVSDFIGEQSIMIWDFRFEIVAAKVKIPISPISLLLVDPSEKRVLLGTRDGQIYQYRRQSIPQLLVFKYLRLIPLVDKLSPSLFRETVSF